MQETSCNLKDCFLCRFCIPEWKEAVAVKKSTLSIRKGRQLFKEGDKVNGIFFIYAGSIKVHQQWTGEKELILRFARAGEIVGHRGFGGGDTYPIGATALEDSTLCFISNEFLEATCRTNPSFTYELMQFYAAELQRAERRMRNLVHMEVKSRIADVLLELAAFFGVDKDDYIAITLTRQDIASYAGTTYETIFKFFTELTQAKIISTSGKSIRIDDPEKLKQYIAPSIAEPATPVDASPHH